MKRKIKAIVFDLDDTLYSENSFRKSGYGYVAKKLKNAGYPLTKQKITQLSKKYPQDLFDKLILLYKLPYKVSELINWYRYHIPQIVTYQGVPTLLKKLKRDYKIGLLTDYFYRSQLNKIKALGIKKYFDGIVYTEKISAQKPSAKGFELLKKRFHCSKNEIIYVGDNEIKDFSGANKSGYITVKYNNNNGFYNHKLKSGKIHKAYLEVQNLKEIFAILTKLNQ